MPNSTGANIWTRLVLQHISCAYVRNMPSDVEHKLCTHPSKWRPVRTSWWPRKFPPNRRTPPMRARILIHAIQENHLVGFGRRRRPCQRGGRKPPRCDVENPKDPVPIRDKKGRRRGIERSGHYLRTRAGCGGGGGALAAVKSRQQYRPTNKNAPF